MEIPRCSPISLLLHRRQLPRNLSPVFRIMKRHPAPAERNHPFRDTLIRLRISIPDTSLDQPPQKPMMLNKRLQKPIHLRQLPAPEHLLLRLLLMLSVYRTHRHHTMDIRHTDRIRPLRHKQSSLTHPISTPYLPVKISMVSHHIRGKKPQPLRKHPAVLPKSRHLIRRQMKQNRPHIPRQKTGRINIRRNLFLHSQLQTGLDSLHPPLSRRHIPQRQIRIPIQNTRRKPQLNNPAGQIPPRDLTTLLSPPRKIKKLSPRNIPQIHIHKPLNNLPSPPRLKRRIQKRQNHIITQTTHSPSKTQAAPKKTTLKTRPTQTSEAITQPAATHIRSSHSPRSNTQPQLFSQATHLHTSKAHTAPAATHIRRPSLKPLICTHLKLTQALHQHTFAALLSSLSSAHIRRPSLKPLICIHPQLFSQASYLHTSKDLLSSLSSAHIQRPSLKPLKKVTITPDINQPIRPTIFFHNYNPKSPKNKFKYYTKTPQKTPQHIHPSADATPFVKPQGNSAFAAIQRSADGPSPPGKPPPLTPPKNRTDRLPAGRLHGRDPVRRSKPLVILGA